VQVPALPGVDLQSIGRAFSAEPELRTWDKTMATRSAYNTPYAAAAANLGEALFPDARTVASGRIAGQQLSELAARTRKSTAEAAGIEDQNSALAAAVLESAGFDPREIAVTRAGRGNAQQIMEALQTSQQMQGDRSAADAFSTGDYTGASAGRLSGGRDPLAVNKIEGGYQINPFEAGGEMTATGETLADIIASQALARQRDAQAGYDHARTAQPERFRAPGAAKANEISPTEAGALDDLIGNFLPSMGKDMPAVIDPMLRNEVLTRATQIFRETGNAQTAVQQAFGELVQQTQEGSRAVEGVDNWDFFGLGTPDVEAAPAKPYKFDRKSAAAAAAPQASGGANPAEQIRAEFKAGRMTREAAKAALQKLGFK
jgi:hypothetical protein